MKNVTGQNNSLNLTSVNDNLPSSFTTNIRDILATEENKQRAIKYVIQKRNEEKYGTRGPITTDNNQEESNPVLSNKYYKYSRNINLKTDNDNKNIDINNNQGNQTNVDSKYSYSNYYTRRNRNNANLPDNNNNLETNNENINNKIENNNRSSNARKKFQVSASATNIIYPTNNLGRVENNNNSIYFRRNRRLNANNTNNDNIESENKDIGKDKVDGGQIKYNYRRFGPRFANEQNDKNEKKEEQKPNDNRVTSIPLNLKVGYNFSFKNEEMNDYDLAMSKKGSKELSGKNKFIEYIPSISKNYTYVRQRNRKGDTDESQLPNKKERKYEITKENNIEIKNNSENLTNTRFRRKYGRFSNNTENNDNLSFKDEKELVNYINKKYKQDKIIELFDIKNDENEKNQREIDDLKDKLNDEIKKR